MSLDKLLEVQKITKLGFAGVDKDGRTVDRRLYKDAIPMQKNRLLNIPEPKKVDGITADLLLFFQSNIGCKVRIAGLGNPTANVLGIDIDKSLVKCNLGDFDPRRLQYLPSDDLLIYGKEYRIFRDGKCLGVAKWLEDEMHGDGFFIDKEQEVFGKKQNVRTVFIDIDFWEFA
jgi:hypothetical protein